MFLEEKLLIIGRRVDIADKNSCKKAIQEMVSACMGSISDHFHKDGTLEQCTKQFQWANKTWELAVDKLDSEGFCFVKREGFRIFVESKEEFKDIKL